MTDTTLAQRLRDQRTLPVCPYDRRSPDYRTAPNDKPCPMCGGEPEGPDKCTGADLRVMAEAADRIEALEREKEELRKERDEARQALEHDRSKVIEAVNQFSDAFARRSWLLDSRGPYEWDDDRYRDEFRCAYDELAAPIQQLKAIGKDWSNCPTNHDEIMRARTDWQTRAETAERQLAERDAALRAIVERSNNDPLGTSKVNDMRNIARAALAGSGDGWREITDDERPPHDVPVLLWQPPSMSHPNGLIEARPFSTGRSGKGWSEYSQHSWATHWMPLPASPSTAGER